MDDLKEGVSYIKCIYSLLTILLLIQSLVSQLPSRQTIAVVPDINWEQYNEVIIDEGYNTRKKKIAIKESKDKDVVEKTIKDKQNSHGQPWTEEEQVHHVIVI